MDPPEPGPLADRPNPPVGGPSIQAAPVAADQDRPLPKLCDSQVDGAGGARHQRDERRLVAFADDA